MRVWLIIPLLLLTACDRTPRGDEPLTLFAAASLGDVMTDIAARYTKQTGRKVTCSFAGSSTLARQIETGAPADVFVSAHPKWMDYLQDRGAIDPATRTDIARNRLVVITRGGQLAQGDLRTVLTRGRVAIGDPDHVPAGIYAKQALQSLDLWDAVAAKIIPAADVRAALRLVETGEAYAAVVYSTDVRLASSVRVAHKLPDNAHDPILYVAAATQGRGEAAADFVRFMSHGEAQTILRAVGFATDTMAR